MNVTFGDVARTPVSWDLNIRTGENAVASTLHSCAWHMRSNSLPLLFSRKAIPGFEVLLTISVSVTTK